MNKYYRKFKKNAKALSPVVASIILIAVTVAVSVVVAAWMSGMTIGLMGNAEQVSVTNVAFSPGTGASGADQLVVTVTNSGSTLASISTVYINGATVTPTTTYPSVSPAPSTTPAPNTIPKASSAYVTLTLPNSATLSPGTAYTVKLITAKGTSVVSAPTTYSP
jgi:flagellin-like protein